MTKSERRKMYHGQNREKENRQMRQHAMDEKMQVIGHYGGKCACCGERRVEFLTVDHMAGGGSQHRKIIGGKIHRWLIKNGFPGEFQILCFNCNSAKALFGVCPHRRVTSNKMEDGTTRIANVDTKFHDDLAYPPTTGHKFTVVISVDAWVDLQERVLELVNQCRGNVDGLVMKYWLDILDGVVPSHIRLTRPDPITKMR